MRTATILPSYSSPPPPSPGGALGPVKATLTVSNSAEWINPTNLLNAHRVEGGADRRVKGTGF